MRVFRFEADGGTKLRFGVAEFAFLLKHRAEAQTIRRLRRVKRDRGAILGLRESHLRLRPVDIAECGMSRGVFRIEFDNLHVLKRCRTRLLFEDVKIAQGDVGSWVVGCELCRGLISVLGVSQPSVLHRLVAGVEITVDRLMLASGYKRQNQTQWKKHTGRQG